MDAQTGEVCPLTTNDVHPLREKTTILASRQDGVLPVDAQGYGLGEYARRTERWLGDRSLPVWWFAQKWR